MKRDCVLCELLVQEHSPTGMAALLAMKEAFDPQGVMNLAKVFAEVTENNYGLL